MLMTRLREAILSKIAASDLGLELCTDSIVSTLSYMCCLCHLCQDAQRPMGNGMNCIKWFGYV